MAESAVNFECKLTEVVQLRDHKRTPVAAWLVLGEVVAVHIRKDLLKDLLKDGLFDTFGAGIILRAGGPSAYALVAPESRFDISRPPGVNHPATR